MYKHTKEKTRNARTHKNSYIPGDRWLMVISDQNRKSSYLYHWVWQQYRFFFRGRSTLIKYQWVLYQIILPHLQEDVLLGCVKKEFLNKLLDSCQGYCKNGGYYAYKLLNIILNSAYEYSYIQDGELLRLKSFPEPRRKAVILSQDQIRKLLSGAAQTNAYFEILLALFCGLTKGEILGLKYSDFKRNKHTLTIQRTCSENRSKLEEPVFTSLSGTTRNRTLKIPPFISHELFKRKKENQIILAANPGLSYYQDFVCLGPTARIKSYNNLSTTLRNITKNSYLPPISMIDLRRMSAFILADMGVSIEMIVRLSLANILYIGLTNFRQRSAAPQKWNITGLSIILSFPGLS